jgi:hypothetical protein
MINNHRQSQTITDKLRDHKRMRDFVGQAVGSDWWLPHHASARKTIWMRRGAGTPYVSSAHGCSALTMAVALLWRSKLGSVVVDNLGIVALRLQLQEILADLDLQVLAATTLPSSSLTSSLSVTKKPIARIEPVVQRRLSHLERLR